MNLFPYFILAVAFSVALYFIFRKKKTVPFGLEARDKDLLSTKVAFYNALSAQQKLRFEQKISEFLGSIKIEGVGTTISPLDRILVGASAVIPIFGFDEWKYKNLGTVLLYPDTFNKDFQFTAGDRNIMGMVGDGYMNGQMILSQSALRQGFANATARENTGIHEFVHLLDKSDGATDGIPQNFMKHEYATPWIKLMHQKMKAIAENHSDINPYALTNEAEFFAVVAEYFFEKPEQLKHKHPRLYEQLSEIFSQDLA